MTFLRRFEDPPYRVSDPDAAEADSIVQNLTHILRSQSGFALRLLSPNVSTLPRTPVGSLQFLLTGQLGSGKRLRALICMSRSPGGGSLLDVRMQG